MTKRKGITIDLQNTTQKIKEGATRTHKKSGEIILVLQNEYALQ